MSCDTCIGMNLLGYAPSFAQSTFDPHVLKALYYPSHSGHSHKQDAFRGSVGNPVQRLLIENSHSAIGHFTRGPGSDRAYPHCAKSSTLCITPARSG